MPKDLRLISTERHEVINVLDKYDLRATEDNINKLIEKIKLFKKQYSSHQRYDFYQYVQNTNCLKDLEDKQG